MACQLDVNDNDNSIINRYRPARLNEPLSGCRGLAGASQARCLSLSRLWTTLR
jgi:hypothetical protein